MFGRVQAQDRLPYITGVQRGPSPLPMYEGPMTETRCVAVCCYKSRAITSERCAHCQPDFGCLGFGSSAELAHFTRLIPPSMLGAPLPLNLWPKFWKAIEPDAEPILASDPTPARLFVAALSASTLPVPRQPQNPEP